MRKQIFVFLVILLFLIGCASEISGGKILKHGIYTSTEVKIVKAEGTAAEKRRISEDVEFTENTTQIPAILGNTFGIKYVINGKPEGRQINIRVLWKHPPMKNPQKEKASTISEHTRKAKIGNIIWNGYQFDEEWELVAGKWTIHIYHKDQKLLEKTFTVYMP